MRCANCGYGFQSLEERCPRCGWKEGDPVEGKADAREAAAAGPRPAAKKRSVGSVELALKGALAGALFGGIFGLVSTLTAWFTGGAPTQMDTVVALLIGTGAGALEGAIVGIVVVFSRSVPTGIATGAVLEAAVKLTVLSALGLWWGFSAIGVAISVFFGAAFGWVVASQVYNSIRWDEIA